MMDVLTGSARTSLEWSRGEVLSYDRGRWYLVDEEIIMNNVIRKESGKLVHI